MGWLTQRDAKLYRGFFKEMARLRGLRVEYRYAVETDPTIHAEFQSELSDPIEMDIIFQENPKVNTLRRIGWVSENPEDKPYIAMLPFDAPNLTVQSHIDIPPYCEINTRARRFRINTITTLIEFPDCYICTLAPVFDNEEVKDDYSINNFNYLEDPNEN